MRAGPSVIDIGPATYGVLATVAAIYDRERTGRGQLITSGLFETTVFLSVQHVAQAVIQGHPPLPMPSRGMGSRLGWGVYQLFQTRDDRQVFIAITSNAHWERFCTELGLLDLLADPDLDTNNKRCENRPRIIPRIEAIARTMTSAELVMRLEQARVPYSPVNSPLDVLDDPQLQASGTLHDVRIAGPDGDSGDRTVQIPGLPIASDGFKPEPRHDPPGLGQHTRELLAEVGYPPQEIERLIDARVVRADGPTLTQKTSP
jgi:crotonobetainyl-CoA:carnitine CoA-transferase CaiB-like acyl-CoA transferase